MPTFTLTTTINAAPTTVWDIITDIENSPKVTPEITRIEMLTPPPFRVGTRWRETRRMNNREGSVVLEVTEFAPGRSCSVRSTLMGTEFNSQFTITRERDATRLDLHTATRPISFGGRLFSLLTPVFIPAMKKTMQRDLEAIKRAAESR